MKTNRFVCAIVVLSIAGFGRLASAGLVGSGTLNLGCSMSCGEMPRISGLGSMVVVEDATSMISLRTRPDDLFVEIKPADAPVNAARLCWCSDEFRLVTVYVAPATAKVLVTTADVIAEGDLSIDGKVSEADLDLLKSFWGLTVAPFTEADASGDGFVGSADLDIVRGNWER